MKRYPGGKNAEGTHQWILGRMRPHTRYAECFVGSGAIVRRKVPTLETVVCDVDEAVADYWYRLAFPGVRAHHGCGIAWLRDNAQRLDDEWLVYLDPPYLHATRVKRKMYRHEMTDDDHRELLRVVQTLRCGVMLSGYPSKMYDQALTGWERHTRRVMTRGHTWRTEVLWCNFSDDASADYAAAVPGRDWRERDRIKKRLRRWRAKYAAMPVYERTAVLAELVRMEQQASARATSDSARPPGSARKARAS